ncbi:hypothetical protein V1525DRAFT_4614 [Lipomyces kononenkoae]|uniref:Uncharacterized protein n=1 Tax=Lipomyces kononenkoae TaxID=34357 RepID=A0ACC3TBY4_LIPKO
MPRTGDNIRELQIFESAGLKRWTPGSFVALTLASRATITTGSVPSNRNKLNTPEPVNNRQSGKQRTHRRHASNSDGRQEWSAEDILSLNIFGRFVYGTGNAEGACENIVVQQRLAEILFPGRPYSEVFEKLQIYRRDATSQPVSQAPKRRKTSSKLQELQEYANSDRASKLCEHDDADDNDSASSRETWAEKREKLDALFGLKDNGQSPSSGNAIHDNSDTTRPDTSLFAGDMSVRVKRLDEVLGLGEFASRGAGEVGS